VLKLQDYRPTACACFSAVSIARRTAS
jgi:hypothetical protein